MKKTNLDFPLILSCLFIFSFVSEFLDFSLLHVLFITAAMLKYSSVRLWNIRIFVKIKPTPECIVRCFAY